MARSKPEDAVPHNNGPSYDVLKKQLLQDKALFEDPDFPAIDSSMFFSQKPPRPFVWKRPAEITESPKLFVGGASRFDIEQGMLGDCWLLAALAGLCQYKGLLHQVVPPDQTFQDEEGYCGMFRFRFWQYGKWEEVVVDDRLPTYNNRLVFLSSAQGNEFWSALLEKAYAKLCGTYEALKGGQTSEAMEDFTGGLTEDFDMQKITAEGKVDHFFKVLLKAQERQSLMCCSLEADPSQVEAKCDNGLIKGHAYTLTGVKKVDVDGKPIQLVRVRNPWGNEREWNGAWSDESAEWKLLSDQQKQDIGLNYDDDGEFWMSLADFTTNFMRVEICMLSPDSAGGSEAKCWAMQINQNSWRKHVTAGGCRNFPDTFHLNPQIRIKLEDPDDDEDVDNCTIVVGVMQKGRRKQKRIGAQNLTIGFAIYEIGDDAAQYMDGNRLAKDFFLYHRSAATSATFINARSITNRFSLPPGEYCVLPSTFQNGEEGDFVLRMFSEKAQGSQEMDTPTQVEPKPQAAPSLKENEAFDAKFKPFFDTVAGVDGQIDAFELQQVVNSAFKTELMGKDFSLEACRSMVAMTDMDRAGSLDYTEFRDLWRRVMMSWRETFHIYDQDNSGAMSAMELRGVLAKIGFKLSTPVLSSIVLRYSNKKGTVNFDDYIQICCRLTATFTSYMSFQGKSFTLDDFIVSAIYT